MTSESKSHDSKPVPARKGGRRRRAAVVSGLAAGVALMCAAAIPASAATAPAPHAAGAGAAGAAAVAEHSTAGASPNSVVARQTVAYWTRARMLSAHNAASITLTSAPGSATGPGTVSGPAGRVAGAAPSQALKGSSPQLAAPARRGVTPDSGAVGSPWPGYLYSAPATTTGKVFFTTHNGENWVCSASTVNSNGKDAVLTAGHCVYGSLGGEVPGEGWHTNWMFVPDYDNGYAPYGVWTARELVTLGNYASGQDEGDDIGGAVINTSSYGQHIVNVVGGQGFAWNWSTTQAVYDFGYPAAAPFNGATLQYCNGSEFAWSGISATMGLNCNFTGGSSGGPWIMDFNGSGGYINGVNDFGYSSLPTYIFSADFGNNADAVYNTMANL